MLHAGFDFESGVNPSILSSASPPHTHTYAPAPQNACRLKAATAQSQACIAAGAVVQVLLNLLRPHPMDPDLPLVDFTLALTLLPVLLAGIGIGE